GLWCGIRARALRGGLTRRIQAWPDRETAIEAQGWRSCSRDLPWSTALRRVIFPGPIAAGDQATRHLPPGLPVAPAQSPVVAAKPPEYLTPRKGAARNLPAPRLAQSAETGKRVASSYCWEAAPPGRAGSGPSSTLALVNNSRQDPLRCTSGNRRT